jgi:hypothetical protein
VPADPVRRQTLLVVLVGLVVGSWMLVTPPGGGPDEASHLVRAGGVARGHIRSDGGETFVALPDRYLLPDVTCWAFQPTVSAACATPRPTSGATIEIPTRAGDYPVWSHLWSGLASRLPGDQQLWWARAANAVLATLLVAGALAAVAGRRLAAASVLCALTPMAWFTFGIVNPSSTAIAGALAFWVGLVHRPDARWLAAAGWAAMALPRRDGLIWASLALAIVLAATDRRLVEWWRALGRGPQLVVGASTLATVVWGVTSRTDTALVTAASPLGVIAVDRSRRWWLDGCATGRQRRLTRSSIALATVVGVVVALQARPGGWDGELAGRVIGQTGDNLVEAIGVLGWLDTTLPWLAVAGWVVAIGALAGAALVERAGHAIVAAVVVTVAIVTAWVFELFQGNDSGTYWQGRYSLPLLVGVPIVLGAALLRPDIERAVARVVVIAVLLIDNVALVAAARRFGVGVDGSLLPWRWDTYRAPVPPVLVIACHLVATIVLGSVLIRSATPTVVARSRHPEPANA